LPDELHPKPIWPELPLSGIEPKFDAEEVEEREHRLHV